MIARTGNVGDAGGRLAIAVVNYNTRDLLRECLATVPAAATTVVIDNASTDGSAAMVAAEFPRVRLVASRRNPGPGCLVFLAAGLGNIAAKSAA